MRSKLSNIKSLYNIEMNLEEKPPDDFFKCVKVPLQHVLKHKALNQPKINDVVMKAHQIVIHTLQFMKLYLTDYFHTHQSLPKVDKMFVNCCMKIVCVKKTKQGKAPKQEVKELKEHLASFHATHYKDLTCHEPITYTCMNTVLDYLTIDILTMYENNIKQHYVEYVERYVNVVWKKSKMIEWIRKVKHTKQERDQAIRKFCSQLRYIKHDILNIENTTYKSDKSYHTWIRQTKLHIVPTKTTFQKNSLYYDLQCNPQDYFGCMVCMMNQIELQGEPISNVFPMRTDIIPKHVRIDTTTLVQILLTKKQGKKGFYLRSGNLKRYENKLWDYFFNTKLQCFNKKWYSFHHMIETDGVSCSLLFLRNDKVGKRMYMSKIPSKETYIDEVVDTSDLQDKTIVAIDPNMSDLLYCVDGDTRDRTHFRYTQDQRRKETKLKKYQHIQQLYKQELIDGKSVIEWETELSLFNRKTLQLNQFKDYCKKKNEINKLIWKCYEQHIFRKLKLNGYMNRLRSEQKMLMRFTKLFGSSRDTIVCFGDWEQRKHRKYKEPIKGKGFRTFFKRNGFQTFLVDEFRTSCKCSNCEGGSCENFRVCRNPKPQKSNHILKHGVLMCKTCTALWNRDENSARNIYKIAYNAIHNT